MQWNEKYEKVIGRKMTHLVSFMFYLKKKSEAKRDLRIILI